VNQAKEFLYRECSNGQWSSEPVCFAIQADPLPQCPDGFIEKGDICYTFSPKSTFPPTCPFQDVLPFNVYSGIIGDEIVEPVWMPVTRDLSNGFGFFQWTEASELYKSTYNYGSLTYDTSIRDKNCVLYCKECTKVAVPCNEEHPAVCAYNKLSMVTNALCDSLGVCHQSDFDSRSTCFCLVQDSNGKAEFLKPYQNYVYDVLTTGTCGIGLQKTINGSYIWETSKQEISYTFWSKEVVFDSTHVYGASSPDGWVLTENPGSCFVVEQELAEVEPKLKLDLDQSNNYFVLEVTNPMWIKMFQLNVSLFCFTDAHPKILVQSIPITDILKKDDDVVSYKFAPVESGPGHYWCEAFDFVSLNVINSEVVFLRDVAVFEFVALFKVKYSSTMDPIDTAVIKYLESTLLTRLLTVSYLQTYYTPRIMKIEDFDEKNLWIWVNIHFSANADVDISNGESKEYDDIRNLIDDDLSTTQDQIQIVDFFHMDYCNAESGQLTWPKVALNEESHPEEFCFVKHGTLVLRRCEGNFIDGARWLPFEECEMLPYSEVTSSLILLYRDPVSVDILNISKILEEHFANEFVALDIYLLAECLSNLDPNKVDIETFGQVIDNILKIDKKTLKEAQLKTQATDILLRYLREIMHYYPSSFQIIKEKFAMIREESAYIKGIFLEKIDGRFQVTPMSANSQQVTQQTTYLDGMFWLNSELQAEIAKNSEKITFVVFFDDGFFTEAFTGSSKFTPIFAVHLGSINKANPLPGTINTQQLVPDANVTEKNCVVWYNSSVWKRYGESQTSGEVQNCHFWNNVGYGFAVSFIVDDHDGGEKNVTTDLIDLLNTDTFDNSEVVERLAQISERYEDFVSQDVSLVGQVLGTMRDHSDIKLDSFAKMVDNLHKINRSILAESQLKDRATDSILFHIDAILQNSNQQSEIQITTDNFMIFSFDLKEFDFTGLVLWNEIRRRSFQAEILFGDVSGSDTASSDNFDSSVVLSPELKDQIGPRGKAIITVFSSDALFNENKSQHQFVSKIFGVMLPKTGNFSGPVSVLHKLSGADRLQQCAHWNYSEGSGFWKDDTKAQDYSWLIQCDFWHTTHFALLLLDEDKFPDNFDILDWITTVNCIISLLGLGCIILTAVLFEKWRKNIGNQILLNFAFVIALQIVAFYVSNIHRHSQNDFLCIFVGAFLHYSLISQFFWMLIIAVLQFKRFVEVFGSTPKWLLFKTCFCGWVFPLVPVVTVLSLNPYNYTNGNVGFCYPSGWGLYLGVWLPIVLIVVTNFVIFIYIMYTLVRRRRENIRVTNNEAKYEWRLSVLLFFMLGLTWTFGFLANLDSGAIFAYLFDFTATLQGFVVFLYFIVFNSSTRQLYIRAIKRLWFRKNF
jgi:uncharacterized membrane protein